MTVYVDDAAILWRSKLRFHLSADSVLEMHEFADRVGIKRCWFHRGSAYPHYDVTAEQRERALQAGARAVTSRELVVVAKALRKSALELGSAPPHEEEPLRKGSGSES